MVTYLIFIYKYKFLTSKIIGTGAKGKFSGGFDINAFGGLQAGKCTHAVYNAFLSLC